MWVATTWATWVTATWMGVTWVCVALVGVTRVVCHVGGRHAGGVHRAAQQARELRPGSGVNLGVELARGGGRVEPPQHFGAAPRDHRLAEGAALLRIGMRLRV